MFLRTADDNSFSTATGSTMEGGRMSSKVKIQSAKIDKANYSPLIFVSVQVNKVDINKKASFKSCLMLSCTIFKIQKNVVGGSETMYVRVLNDINETYRG